MEDAELLLILCVLLSAIYFIQNDFEAPRKRRRVWIKPWVERRELGLQNTLLQELRLEDREGYRRFLRMSSAKFEWLLDLVTPIIGKQTTVMRDPISPATRLSLTLRYLATGETRSSLHFQFRIGRSTVSGIILEVCKALTSVLQDFIKVPSSTQEWLNISNNFWQIWNFPLVLGALDGKHVAIHPPAQSGSHFINYKGSFSVVLLALVDANLNFLYVDIGTNGRISDGGIYSKSNLKKAVDTNKLKMPISADLPNSRVHLPFSILADDAFPLSERLMKPYPQKDLTFKKRIYNYRLSRARRVVENAFGILVSRFGVYQKPMNTQIESINHIVMATCSLHNMLRKTDSTVYIPPGFIDNENILETTVRLGDWRQNANLIPLRSRPNRPTQAAMQQRDLLCEYFSAAGAVPWQEAMINR